MILCNRMSEDKNSGISSLFVKMYDSTDGAGLDRAGVFGHLNKEIERTTVGGPNLQVNVWI